MAVTDHRAGADTAGYDLFWVEEVNWGQVPAGPPQLNTARVTSETLALAKTTAQSQEITGDGQVSDIILTALEAGGDIAFELSLDDPGGGHLRSGRHDRRPCPGVEVARRSNNAARPGRSRGPSWIS